ncbi:hypothetical protein [Nonomuraea sp. NPDC050310]|uniref:hypothetical protein n=1 Tax=Nonomuraea sp. NPDC050310 TaxID=3154935 RepID=UPI0033F4F829
MYTILIGDDDAERQIADLSDDEIDALLEVYDVLRLTPDNGRKLGSGNMLVWDHRTLQVIYFVLEPQGEVVILRVNRFPELT